MTYNWFIEVRTMSEKYQLKKQIYRLGKELRLRKTPKVPHLSLVYEFSPMISAYKIASIIQQTAKNYGKLSFSYDGWDLTKGEGGYVFDFKINPSPELREFRYDLYNNLKPYIYESSSSRMFNSKSAKDFWFHASIAYHLDENTAERIKRFIDGNAKEPLEVKPAFNIFNIFRRRPQKSKITPFSSDARVVRIPVLRSAKITYEYDVVLDRILNRREALSKQYFEMDRQYNTSTTRKPDRRELFRKYYRNELNAEEAHTLWMMNPEIGGEYAYNYGNDVAGYVARAKIKKKKFRIRKHGIGAHKRY